MAYFPDESHVVGGEDKRKQRENNKMKEHPMIKSRAASLDLIVRGDIMTFPLSPICCVHCVMMERHNSYTTVVCVANFQDAPGQEGPALKTPTSFWCGMFRNLE